MRYITKNIFLVDGIGALTTAILLRLVLARFVPLFGVPQDILILLSDIAVCFALYSLACHFLVNKYFERFLTAIIVANLLYCITTSILVILNFEMLTWLGVSYFCGEIVIILLLVMVEYRIIFQQQQSTKQSEHT